MLPAPLGLAIIAICCSSCSNRQLTTFRNPDYPGASYRRIVVYVDTADLQWRHDLEEEMVRALRERSVDAVESLRLMSPTRQWSDSERMAYLAENGFDGYLRLTLQGIQVHEYTVPSTTTTTVRQETKPGKGSSSEIARTKAKESTKQTVETKMTEGYVAHEQRLRYGAYMIDAASGATSWIVLHELVSSPASFSSAIADQILADSVALPSAGISPW